MRKCPKCCSETLRKYDKIKRLVKRQNGEKEWIDIYRYKCDNCKSIHRELPDFIIPFKQYDVNIIYGVQNGYITSNTLGYEDYPCEETMKRWKKQCARK